MIGTSVTRYLRTFTGSPEGGERLLYPCRGLAWRHHRRVDDQVTRLERGEVVVLDDPAQPQRIEELSVRTSTLFADTRLQHRQRCRELHEQHLPTRSFDSAPHGLCEGREANAPVLDRPDRVVREDAPILFLAAVSNTSRRTRSRTSVNPLLPKSNTDVSASTVSGW